MTSEQKIFDWISDLITKFPNIIISYAYDEIIETHIIEVSPDYIENSNEYSESYLDFVEYFNIQYPKENILISVPSLLHNMSNLKYYRNGEIFLTNTEKEQEFFIKNNQNNTIIDIYPIAA